MIDGSVHPINLVMALAKLAGMNKEHTQLQGKWVPVHPSCKALATEVASGKDWRGDQALAERGDRARLRVAARWKLLAASCLALLKMRAAKRGGSPCTMRKRADRHRYTTAREEGACV